MRKMITIICIFLLSSLLNAQELLDVLDIRNFNHSLVLVKSAGSVQQNHFSDYGQVVQQSHSGARYLFQGQEQEQFLGLYLFHSRIYSFHEKRFFQPDPQSQFHSPYLFVASDPVNIIDLGGELGKPLVLYERQTDYGEDFNQGIADLKQGASDAHYLPLDEFLNSESIDLPEWNGNVFIRSHMSVSTPDVLEVERFYGEGEQKLRADFTETIYNDEMDATAVRMDAKEFGRKLRKFADSKKVKVKNIFAGGCEGAETGKQIAAGYTETASRKKFTFFRRKAKLKVYGAKQGVKLSYRGPNNAIGDMDDPDAIPFDDSRVYLNETGQTYRDHYYEFQGKKYLATYKVTEADGTDRFIPYIRHEELPSFVNSRIPKSAKNFFTKLKLIY